MVNSKSFTVIAVSILLLSGMQDVFASESGKTQNFTLDPIVITASRAEKPISEAKADISVVSREKIEQMHIETVEEALRTVPGVQFLNYGATGMHANLSGVRINGSKDIVILIDGVRVTDFQGAGNSGYMYAAMLNNMDNIERIEVLRGSAATVYGSGAKGGVINIITRSIKQDKTLIDLAGGEFGKESYKLNTQGKKGKFDYNVYYSNSLRGNIKDAEGKTWEGHSDANNAGGTIKYNFSDDNALLFSINKIRNDYSAVDAIYNQKLHGCRYDAENWTIKNDYKISEKWHNTFTYRKNDVKSIGFKNNDTDAFWHSDYAYYFVSDQLNYSSSKHNLVMGIDYSNGKNNLPTKLYKDNQGNIVKGQRSMYNFSYYIQDDWNIFPKLTLSAGLRYDKPVGDEYSPIFNTHTSKSYKLSYDVTDNDVVYAGRSDFYILPSMEQLYNDKYGNAKLNPAYGRTTSVGYNKKFDDNNVMTFNWFSTKGEVSIGYDIKGQYQNYNNDIARGWNTQFNTEIGERWNASIGWEHLYQYSGGDNYSLGYSPKDRMTLGINYKYKKLQVGIDGFYFIRRVSETNQSKKGWPSDKYGVYNLSVNYTPSKNINYYIKVENIFDKLWAEHTNVIHQGGQAGDYYTMPGRNFILGVQMTF